MQLLVVNMDIRIVEMPIVSRKHGYYDSRGANRSS